MQITVIGNLVEDPELRFTPAGVAVANFRVAATTRVFDKDKGGFIDGEPMFLTCQVWRAAAENVAESLSKGQRVIVAGKLKQRSFEKDGQKRSVFEVEVDEVGPSLLFATAAVTRAGGKGKPAADDAWGGPSQASNDPIPF